MENKEEILRRIQELETLLPKDNAYIELSIYGGGPDESKISGNPQGYTGLGLTFLKAPFNKDDEQFHERMDAELGKVISTDSEIQFSWFEITDDLKRPIKYETTVKEKIVPYLFIGILVSILLFAVIGVIFSLHWLMS